MLLEENIGQYLHNHRIKTVLERTQKEKRNNENKFDFIKILNFSPKDTINKTKRQATV